ncbi:MAG TPA: toll/interleukin-1 receptor domain-containing protein [Sphingomicrobium sp.]|nr:toll/interleukin-1 receptor domain-containing protein [Sphingomicrobium sp.]
MPKLARLQDWERARGAEPDSRTVGVRPLRYCAFLSYSHADEAVAGWLHDALEKFRTPSSLAGRMTHNGAIPKRLTPIFRDRHELPASDNLAAGIRDALDSSRFLIVLCSPAAAASRWVNAEIDMFKRHRPDGCVLAAIVAGEPFASDVPGREAEECLPPALRQKYDRRGRPTSKRAEPLAADLREDGDGKRLGLLKLVSGMLGVGLDDLVQRETQRRQRRLAIVAAASLAGMAVTSGLAVFAFDSRDEARDQRREAEGLVGFMLGDLREKLEPLGRLDTLDAVGSRALGYFEKQDKSELSDEALAQRARALTLIGEIAFTRGNLEGAERRYREAFASTGEAARRYPDDPQRLYDHAQNVFWVGYLAWQRGRPDEAAARFREYRRLAERMVALAPENNDYRREVISAITNLGTVLMDQRRFREAAVTYQASARAAETLAAAEPRNLEYQKQVIKALAWLADAREYAGELEQALATRERQLQQIAELQKTDPRDMQLHRDAMTTHRSIGRLLATRGDLSGGIKESLAGVALSDTLFRVEPDNTEWLQANVSGRFDLADLQLAAGQIAEAASTIRSACDIVDRLAQRNASVTDWNTTKRVVCLTSRARLALRQGAPAEALWLARQALPAARRSPKPIDRGLLAMRSLSVGSNALQALGRRDQAVALARQALQSMPPSIELRPSDKAEVATLQLRIGNRAAAQQLISSLAAIGYRHPQYLAAIKEEERT